MQIQNIVCPPTADVSLGNTKHGACWSFATLCKTLQFILKRPLECPTNRKMTERGGKTLTSFGM